MCSSASELRHHKPKEGDRYLHPTKKGLIFIASSYCVQLQRADNFYLAVPEKISAEDFDGSKYDPESAVSYHANKETFVPLKLEYWTWLPRIEQFQEMLQPLSPMTILHLFYGFVQQGKGRWHSFKESKFPNPTMEQLWMCFTWDRLYDKVWTHGNKWIRKIG
ncbi:hypothetical protein ES705_43821 [subsurface metagenome]